MVLASRKGGIATEFTENEAESRSSDITDEFGTNIYAISGKYRSRSQDSQTQGFQIVRKAVIQTSFKELFEIEEENLAIKPPKHDQVPEVKSIGALKKLVSRHSNNWILHPSEISRGDLLQVEVELGTEPLLRMAAAITTFCNLAENNMNIFGRLQDFKLSEGRSIAHLLESLLADLVPVRGRLVDYDAVCIDNDEVLVHRALLDELPFDIPRIPVFVVGVAQRDQFWKDVSQILFSDAQYTVFCRLMKSGLASKWHPVKALDVFSGIIPDLDEQLQKFNEAAQLGILATSDDVQSDHKNGEEASRRVIRSYIAMLAQHHQKECSNEAIEALVQHFQFCDGWSETVEGRREIFGDVTQRLEGIWHVSTSRQVLHDLRQAALSDSHSENGESDNVARERRTESVSESEPERFLDSEIVAIYW